MIKRLLSVLLALCLGWQAMSFAGAGTLAAAGEEHAHAFLHFVGAAHHHHDHDDGVHEDDSSASLTHIAVDAGLFSPALPSLGNPLVTSPDPDHPGSHFPSGRLRLFPGGLERPPRPTT